ncbi:MAG: DMT family transporter [Maricaulaceae bacterium]|jgi:drug/metabolite transporter (DMT)-like permease
MPWRTVALTVLAMIAFAANSILCRMALKDGLIDPVGFTQIRLAAGAFALAPFLIARHGRVRPIKFQDVRPAFALFAYAIGFSLAYIGLDAGAGALILFACVQITMIAIGVATGARPKALEWTGFAVAFAGLVYLLSPGLSAPPLASALLMAAAGVAWGVYSVLGKQEPDAVAATARNFALALPFAALLFLAGPSWSEAAPAGVGLAIASGAITSGLGYVIWYAALRGLAPMAAPIVQLSVPVIAAAGGVALLGEPFTLRLALASVLILGGIFLTVAAGRARA